MRTGGGGERIERKRSEIEGGRREGGKTEGRQTVHWHWWSRKKRTRSSSGFHGSTRPLERGERNVWSERSPPSTSAQLNRVGRRKEGKAMNPGTDKKEQE